MKSEKAYLQSILEAILKIEQYTAGGYEIFMENSHWQYRVILRLTNIGEAVKHLSKPTLNRHPEIPWKT
ncbi:MAG: DUF86 domain-containing protein [Calditrichaeota bacterium]|nr:DUF86 domain-containing protein [Calditrichota bacterium]